MKYQIINHGYGNTQYFQGCGVAFTKYTHVVTGAGLDAVEAYEDAVEMLMQIPGCEKVKLPKRPRGYGITSQNKVPARYLKSENNEVSWCVSIRVKLP